MTTKDCDRCGEELVFLKDDSGRWVPLDPTTVTEGETVFDPDTHQRHVCVGTED